MGMFCGVPLVGLSGVSIGGVWRVFSTFSTLVFGVEGNPGASLLSWGCVIVSGEGEPEDEWW